MPATKRTFATEHIAEPREQRIELLSASFGPMRASRPCDEQQRAPFSTKDFRLLGGPKPMKEPFNDVADQ